MARTKGSANFSGNLEVRAGAPLDARTKVPTKADLTIASNFPYHYIGLEVYVDSENTKYRLVGSDPTVEKNWEEVGTIQKVVLPTASATEVGKIYEYVGETGSGFVKGCFYECVEDTSTTPSTYSWEQKDLSRELTNEEWEEVVTPLPGKTCGIIYDCRGKEYVVGKFIQANGKAKPLYEATFVTNDIPNSNMKTFNHLIANIDLILHVEGVLWNGGTATPLSRIQDNNTNLNVAVDVDKTQIFLKGRGGNISQTYNQAYIKFRYTKTTDVAA